MDLTIVLIILQLIYLEGILSIDNAAVLAALVSPLPKDEQVPWPGPLQWLRRPVHRLLGGQRMAALKVGLLGAYVGRGLMLFLASLVIRNPWLIILGALYLVKLGAEHLGTDEPGERDSAFASHRTQGRGFWAVVLTVELADLAFSLDNVVVAVALSKELWVILLGVFLGIVTMRFAAGIFVYLIHREPALKPASYVLVLVIGLELLAESFFSLHTDAGVKFLISASIVVGALLYGHVPLIRRVVQLLRWFRPLLGLVNHLFDLALRPLLILFEVIVGGVRAGFRILEARRE